MNDGYVYIEKELLGAILEYFWVAIDKYRETYTGYYDDAGTKWNREYLMMVSNYNQVAKLLGIELIKD